MSVTLGTGAMVWLKKQDSYDITEDSSKIKHGSNVYYLKIVPEGVEIITKMPKKKDDDEQQRQLRQPPRYGDQFGRG